MNVPNIVEQFGGTSAMARLCEVEPSAVSQWKAKNHIPQAHIKFLRLQRPDLFDPPAQPAADDEGRAAA
jgi:hypothetical protein